MKRLNFLISLLILLPWSSNPDPVQAQGAVYHTFSCASDWSFGMDYTLSITYMDVLIVGNPYRIDVSTVKWLTCHDFENWAYLAIRAPVRPLEVPSYVVLGLNASRLAEGQDLSFTDSTGTEQTFRITHIIGASGGQMIAVDPR